VAFWLGNPLSHRVLSGEGHRNFHATEDVFCGRPQKTSIIILISISTSTRYHSACYAKKSRHVSLPKPWRSSIVARWLRCTGAACEPIERRRSLSTCRVRIGVISAGRTSGYFEQPNPLATTLWRCAGPSCAHARIRSKGFVPASASCG
jgi:hypothetical protein